MTLKNSMKDYPWFANYPEGVQKEIDTKAYQSVTDYINHAVEEFSDLPAFENMGKSISYAEFDSIARNFAAYLQNLGLQKGDRIILQMPNILQYPIAVFAALRAGLVIVNTNPLYTASEMKHQFKDSGAKAIVLFSHFTDKLEAIVNETEIEHIILTNLGDLMGTKGKMLNLALKHIKRMVPAHKLTIVPFNKALAEGKKLPFNSPEITLDDIAFLQYTGGTTGISKGAVLTHGSMLANILQLNEWKKILLQKRQETIITALPLYHIFALTVNFFIMLSIGIKNILITNPRDLKSFIATLKKNEFSVFMGVNTLFKSLLDHPKIDQVDFSKLKLTIGGGMSVHEDVALRWKKVTGCNLLEGYGLTETSPVLTCNPMVGYMEVGSIGTPIPNTELSIRDENGQELPIGSTGEIWARGPQIMREYWNNPEETAAVFEENGWLRTGDIGLCQENGFFKIIDRKKEMILVSGFNVFPNEVEKALLMHPNIKEAGVIGVPSEKSGEEVKAFIVTEDGQEVSKKEILQFVKKHLSAYKRPKQIEFRSELPKSDVGKVMRRLLSEGELKK